MKINKLIDKCIEYDVDIVKVHIDVLYEYAKEYYELKQKINDAIKYINKNKQIVSNLKCSAGCSPNEEPKEYNVYKLYCEPTELLEILGDKEND